MPKATWRRRRQRGVDPGARRSRTGQPGPRRPPVPVTTASAARSSDDPVRHQRPAPVAADLTGGWRSRRARPRSAWARSAARPVRGLGWARRSAGASGERSSRSARMPTPVTPSTIVWCSLATSAHRPSVRPSTKTISHSGLSPVEWLGAEAVDEWPEHRDSRSPRRTRGEVSSRSRSGILDRRRVVDAQGHLDDPPPERRQVVEARLHVVSGTSRKSPRRGGRTDRAATAGHVQVQCGPLQVEEPAVRGAEALHARSWPDATRGAKYVGMPGRRRPGQSHPRGRRAFR